MGAGRDREKNGKVRRGKETNGCCERSDFRFSHVSTVLCLHTMPFEGYWVRGCGCRSHNTMSKYYNHVVDFSRTLASPGHQQIHGRRISAVA